MQHMGCMIVQMPAVEAVRAMLSEGGPHVLVCEGLTPSQSAAAAGEGMQADAPAAVTGGSVRVVGMIAEKDYVAKLTHGSFAPPDITAGQIMHSELTPVTADTSVLE